MSRTSINGDILWPASIQYNLNPDPELAFRDKPIHKVVWRGSPDGIYVGPGMNWRGSHRFRMIYLTTSNDTTATRPVRMTRKDRLGAEYQVDVEATLAELNERYSNIRPTFQAVQCEEEICDHINAVLPFQERLSLEAMSEHRYVMDVDGNAYVEDLSLLFEHAFDFSCQYWVFTLTWCSYSARFRTHLMSNQVVLKSTRYPEWYHDRIQPWVHYVR